jgi:hypothetical protein
MGAEHLDFVHGCNYQISGEFRFGGDIEFLDTELRASKKITSATDDLQNNRWATGKGVNDHFMPRRLLCRYGNASINCYQRLEFDAQNETIVFVGDQTEPGFQNVCLPTKTNISFVSCGSYFF